MTASCDKSHPIPIWQRRDRYAMLQKIYGVELPVPGMRPSTSEPGQQRQSKLSHYLMLS
jgi:hypothetical protein